MSLDEVIYRKRGPGLQLQFRKYVSRDTII
jgi:hypothetical protein